LCCGWFAFRARDIPVRLTVSAESGIAGLVVVPIGSVDS
jgi:hypothetical protein